MQPPLLIDWLRQLHLNADATLAAKRWKLAQVFATQATRADSVQVLRTFLFSDPPQQNIQELTSKLLRIDSEFPASNNIEEIRLTSGIVAVAAQNANVPLADAFGLGIRAAAIPTHRCNPAHRGIGDEMVRYLDSKSDALRPSSFGETDDQERISVKITALVSANAEPGAAKKAALEVAKTFHDIYGERIQRLSEEVAIVWWLLGGYSSELKLERTEVSSESYALVAAKEAADRTQLLPPPPSIHAILARAVGQCKGIKKKKNTLKDVIVATDETWRNKFVASHQVSDCADLVPLVTALSKVADVADISALGKALQKVCPGVSSDLAMSEVEAARQLYNELIFLRALAKLS